LKKFNLKTFPLNQNTVFLRLDYNVPIKNGKVLDNTKLKASLQTIKFLLQKRCKIVIAFHLGRPKGKIIPGLKVDPIVKELKKLLPRERITKLNNCIGKNIKNKILIGNYRQIFVLENLRFYKEESQNNLAFAHSLASLAEVYVNDAFANSHRKHASMEAITHFLPSMLGIEIEKELFYLNKTLKPKKPSIWIIGGAKLDKVEFIQQALKKADRILIGGALCFPFLRAKGIKVGNSKLNPNSISIAKKILKNKQARKKIILPLDFVVTEKLTPRTKTEIVAYNQIKSNQIGLDIGPETIKLFKQYLIGAKTILWNGPLGYSEWVKFSKGTKEIGRFLDKVNCIKIAGGGETAEAIHNFHLEHNFTHVSTGGGAALMFLSGEKLPALVALEKNYKKFKRKIKRSTK